MYCGSTFRTGFYAAQPGLSQSDETDKNNYQRQPEDIENMYRRMCFNVFAHNRDDHSKNFTYLYDENKEKWCLSPAYDLTYSSTYYGEHTTTVDGNGSDPGMKELIKVGTKAGMSRNKCRELAEEIQECVNQMLGKYRI